MPSSCIESGSEPACGADSPDPDGLAACANVSTALTGTAARMAVKMTKTLRVSEDGEREGIDIHEHGSPAYHPEPAYMGKGLS